MAELRSKIHESITGFVYVVFIGLAGGLARMLYKQSKGENFNAKRWFINITLSILVVMFAARIVPRDWDIRDAVLWLTGFVSHDILSFFETKGADIIKAIILKMLGLPDDILDDKKKKDNQK